MLRRRRQTKKLLRIARALREVEAVSVRRQPPRRVERVAVGRAAY
jgi:hypothetical protein